MSLTFEQWIVRVDAKLESICGLHSMELDWNYWDAWNGGATPSEAAHDALEYHDFYDFVSSF